MPLGDVDLVRRRFSVGFPIDLVDFTIYSYNDQIFEEKHFSSVDKLINLLKKETKNDKSYWIEVINRSSVNLPNKIKSFCEYFDIHPLTMEDITTLASYMKLDSFYDQSAIYLLMKIISWNGQRVQQQQVSFYLKYSQNILITFQEKSINDKSFFDSIRNHFREQLSINKGQFSYHPYHRLKQMKVDYLFICVFDAIIERYIIVIEEIAVRINEFDEKLMKNKESFTLETFHSIYRLKHDLLHLKILFNPLKEIIHRLQRITDDEQLFLSRRNTDSLNRVDMNHHTSDSLVHTTSKQSIFPNKNLCIYLNDLNGHTNELFDSLEIQHETVSLLASFWLHSNKSEIEKTLKILMLVSVIFIPCLLLTGVNSENFHTRPQQGSKYGEIIVRGLLAIIIIGMIIWYKIKRWI